ncbi:YIEGIA family protein [Halanaerocella petrolearia]
MKYGSMILLGVSLGTLARLMTLRVDYRQYPGYPRGYLVHLTFGFIAAALGGLVVPALLEANYVAVTFLGAAAQQFRGIRTMERDFLSEIEDTELVPRGDAYIENIAKVFEARNYLAMVTAFVSTIGYYIANFFNLPSILNLVSGVLLGGGIGYIFYLTMSEETISDIAKVKVVDLEFTGPNNSNIAVEDVVIMNVGLKESLEKWKESGLGIVVAPKDDDARATLANIGQRQAMIHDIVNQLGVKLDVGVQDYTPLARLNLDTGRVCMIIIPMEDDPPFIKQAVENTPVLEGSRRRPLKSDPGRAAAD